MGPVFRGETVLVTGAAGGLGGEIAMRFAMAGAHVVLHHRSRGDGIAALAERIASEAGVAPDTVRCDLTEDRDLERMFADSPAGRATMLVNNAGSYASKPFLERTGDDWMSSHRLNVVAPFLCMQHAARAMTAHGGGSIVNNITSISADRSTPEQAHYGSSKAALRSLTRTAAVALAPHGIRVNAVSPGLVWRNDLETQRPDGVARWNDRAPTGRTVRPREIAHACVFLCSAQAAGITGHELVVDGGITAVSDY